MVMVNEIPAPTFKERNRAVFLVDRFSELEMLNASIDEKDNVLGIIPGRRGDRDILVVAHLDSLFDETVDHTVTLEPALAIGPGVSDNSLGVAVLGTLPLILERIGLELDANLVLLGSSRSLGQGDLEGLRFVLDNYKRPFTAAVCLEGVKIGRLSFSSIGMLRGELTYKIPEQYLRGGDASKDDYWIWLSTEPSRPLSPQNACARRRAHRCGGIGIRETHPFPG